MVQVASFVVAIALAVSQATAATTCNPGQIYCGATLRSSDTALWDVRINDALRRANQPQDGTRQNDSLFRCVTPTTLDWVDWCIDNGPGVRCQPIQNDTCRRLGGVNECCAR
ncbi:hypothetical protein V8F20_010117 [Naviculisporaceae sp. PSN 640]